MVRPASLICSRFPARMAQTLDGGNFSATRELMLPFSALDFGKQASGKTALAAKNSLEIKAAP
jgi:hypothetical protein